MSVTIEGVQCRLGRDPDDLRRFSINVAVYSQTKPGVKANSSVDPGAAHGKEHLLHMIGVAAAACCEYLHETHGDNVDPAHASKAALHSFAEECRLQEELKKSGPAKIKRLEFHADKLPAQERELLLKLRWLIDKGQALTPVEDEWIDSRIRQIHKDQI